MGFSAGGNPITYFTMSFLMNIHCRLLKKRKFFRWHEKNHKTAKFNKQEQANTPQGRTQLDNNNNSTFHNKFSSSSQLHHQNQIIFFLFTKIQRKTI